MNDCIFCKIARGELPSFKVYENVFVFAFLDKHPINPGHTLVIPKKHEDNFYELDEQTYLEVLKAVREISPIVKKAVNPRRVGLVIAGFDVAHTHIHIIPMHHPDDITSQAYEGGKRSHPSAEELQETQKSLLEAF